MATKIRNRRRLGRRRGDDGGEGGIHRDGLGHQLGHQLEHNPLALQNHHGVADHRAPGKQASINGGDFQFIKI